MVIKQKKYKEIETTKRRGKIRFLERQIEEEEAEREIRTYKPEEKEPYADNDIQNTIRK